MKTSDSLFRKYLLWFLIVFSISIHVHAESCAERGQAAEIFARLDQMNNFTDGLSVADMNVLPVGIQKTVSNVNYALAISNIQFFQEYAELTIWGRAIIPQDEKGDKILFFGAQGIKLSNEGDIIGDARLALLGDITIPINHGAASFTLKGGFDMTSGLGDNQTYMAIDCQGFKELGITADIVLSDKLVRRVDENGNCNLADSRVTASFSTIVQDWNDIVLSLSLPRFEIVGLDGFIFEARDVIFDFSDLRNAEYIQYPDGYREQYLIPGNENLWKGIYIHELSITLPRPFTSRRDSTQRVSFITHHMLFDHNGISGMFEVRDVLSFDDGTAGGWPFSVESFSIELMANHLNGAGFGGKIGLPVAENSPLNYDAYISPDNEYMLRVSKEDTMKFSIWNAEAKLLPNSYVELKVKEGRFCPEAMLSGSMSIKASAESDSTNTIAELPGVKFQRMHLKTEVPYFTVDYLGYDGTFGLKGFPLSVSRIALQTRGREAALGFDAKLNLGEKPFSVTAGTRLEVIGSMKQESGLQSWKYKRTDIAAIRLDASFAETFSLSGSLTLMNNDPVYGDGFAGNIELKFEELLKGAGIKTRAIFGKKDFRYWFADGSILFGKTGVPLCSPLQLSGLGGGVYYRMAQSGIGESALPTGTVYVPDKNRGMGFKAAVLFHIGQPDVVSGDASFEIAFNDKGGLAYMGFFGQVSVLKEVPGYKNMEQSVKKKFGKFAEAEKKYLESHSGIEKGLNKLQKYKLYQPTEAAKEVYTDSVNLGNGGFLAATGIQYDFSQRTFHANFDLYVNVLGGLIRGTGPGNSAGHSVLHIEPGDWYLHLGTPSNRLGIELDLLHLVKIKSGAYFMTGSKLEGSPAPPSQVADILGTELQKLDYMRDFNALGNGRGFAFGTDFRVGTGDITFLILYANFQAGLGFDIMLKDYGEAQCNGHRGPVGIDGWYANGQAYAYLQGEAGINLKLLFIKKKIPVIKAGAATLFQAKLPNPSWFAGYLGVKFDLLGGLVKGKIRLKITFGEECELVMPGGSPLGFPVISDIKPDDQTTDVDVFTAPQVAFNMPVGKSFELEEDAGPKSYRLNLEEFSVSAGGEKLAGRLEWNSNRDAVSFYSHEVLPPQTPLKVLARVCFEEWRNGRWEVVYTAGQKAYEQMEAGFTTGEAPDNIPLQNIEYCYPVKDQQFFLAGESSEGYIQLKRGQSYLFAPEYSHEIRFDGADGTGHRVDFQYNRSQNRLVYRMPAVSGATGYTLNVTVTPKTNTSDMGAVRQEKQLGEGDNEITLRTNTASEVVMTDVGKVLLSYLFKTSRYRTFAEKMKGMIPEQSAPWRDKDYVYLRHLMKEYEPFDLADLTGTLYSGNRPLISAEAMLDDPLYTQTMYPLLYRNYPYPDNIVLRVREPDKYGVPPSRAIWVDNRYLSEIENSGFSSPAMKLFPYTYHLYEVYAGDYYDLRNQVVNRYLGTSRAWKYKELIESNFPAFATGIYRVLLKYAQPDGTTGSGHVFRYEYFYKD